MIRLKAGVSYYTKRGEFTGPLKYWANAGYFTSPLIKNKRWRVDGNEINSSHGLDRTVEPYDLVREASNDETKKESANA